MGRVGAGAVLVLVLATSACSQSVPGVPLAGATATTTTTPVERDSTRVDLMVDGPDCPVTSGDLEGRFTKAEQMDGYLMCILWDVAFWLDETDPSVPTVDFYYVPTGSKGVDESGCEYDDQALTYCSDERSIYFGEAAVWEQYSVYGDGAPVVIAAHEVTHHIQNVRQMPAPTSPREVIRYENQADCGAGAYTAFSREDGSLNVEDDIADLSGSLAAAGEAEGPGRTHGTAAERLDAFNVGYLTKSKHPLAACNRFVPEMPILDR